MDVPIAPVYGSHWSVSGHDVPDDDTPDDAVYLPGRNLLLLALPSVWCQLNGVHPIALGTLKGNPFPDATDAFFAGFSRLVERGMDHALEVLTPFAGADEGRCPGAGTRLGAGAHVLLHRSRTTAAIADAATSAPSAGTRFASCSIEDRTDYAHS